MKTFSEYLEEKKLMTAALVGVVGGFGIGSTLKPKSPESVKQEVVSKQEITSQPQELKINNTTPQDQFKFSHPHIEKFLGSIAKAEHRSIKDVNHKSFDPRTAIRTRGGGGTSSAWGAYQLTRNTVADHFKRRPHIFTGNEHFVKSFISQGTSFLKSSSNHTKYGLGAPGDLASPEHHENYMKMADSVARGILTDKKINYTDGITDEELTKAIRGWRGVPEESDKEYFAVTRKHFN